MDTPEENYSSDIQNLNEPGQKEIDQVQELYESIKAEIQRVMVGNDILLKYTLSGILTGGHILLEGVPGVAKTLLARLVSKCLGARFQRIQFTPDLMPSDLLGTSVFNMQESNFVFKKGPIFSELVLIDEINRAPAKTQAALLEVMEERQVTVDGESYNLGPSFFVIATQNPIEHEGTYPLPDAQLDRFIFKLKVGYPSLEDEQVILKQFQNTFNTVDAESQVETVARPEAILACRKVIEKVHIKPELIQYIAQIVHGTRNNGDLYLGASPRASLAILKTAKSLAAMQGRGFVTPDDVQKASIPVLNHRIVLSPEKEMAGGTEEAVIKSIIKNIEVPR